MLEQIKRRRACRNYDSSREVEDEKIQEILNAGLNAPSGMGRQTPIFVVFKDKVMRDRLMELNHSFGGRPGINDPFYGAPVVILVAAHKDGLSIEDGSAAITNMLIEATNQGLGSCWIHRAKQEVESEEGKAILASLGINAEDYIGVGHVILGYSLQKEYPNKIIKDNRVYWFK